jgi:hypothetical protein
MASGEDGSDQKGVEPVFGGPGAGELQISEESSSPHVRNDELSRSRSPAGELSADVTPDETRIKLCKQSVHACARFGDLEGLQKHLDQRPISVGEQDPQGLTPLHFAASYGEVTQGSSALAHMSLKSVLSAPHSLAQTRLSAVFRAGASYGHFACSKG